MAIHHTTHEGNAANFYDAIRYYEVATKSFRLLLKKKEMVAVKRSIPLCDWNWTAKLWNGTFCLGDTNGS